MYKMKVFKHEVDFYIDLKESSGETFIACQTSAGQGKYGRNDIC